MESILFLLGISFALIRGQAPKDAQQVCRTNFRYRSAHDWIPYVNDTSVGVLGDVKWQILLDQYDYENLVGDGLQPPSPWIRRNFDGDRFEFVLGAGGNCLHTLQVPTSSFQNPNANNWVFTQSVSYLEAIEVVVNATVRFVTCVQRPDCNKPYVTLRRFDTNSPVVSESERVNTANYQPYLGDLQRSRLMQGGDDDTNIVMTYQRPQGVNFTYFAIEDSGTAGMVRRILVYYRVAQGYEDGLSVCPSVALPSPGSGKLNTKACTCKANSTATASLLRTCDENGACKQSPACECDPGFQYNEMLQICQGCPIGTYKGVVSSTSRCRPCPANSMTINNSSTICDCVRGTVRCPEKPDSACQSVEDFLKNPNQCETSAAASGSVDQGGAIAITFFVTLILTAVITALVVFLVLYFLWKK